jgi:hypothetical protein
MADYEGRYINNFFVQSRFYFSPQGSPYETNAGLPEARKLEPISDNALQVVGGHTIEIENLTTLPCDVEVWSAFPDAADGLFFYIDKSTQPSWAAAFKSILNSRRGKSCPVVHGNNLAPMVRLQTTFMRFKRPIWIEWQEESIDPIIELAVEDR